MERYMPCWSERSQGLLDENGRTQDHGTAEELLESVQQNRKERCTDVGNMDFMHSSRHAWQTTKKLDSDSRPTKSAPLMSPDEIAKEIKKRGKHTKSEF
ncbi:RNA-directed DNA polymerase from mobile element jockey-like protein [Elysia marginata]|uniref:RNA-directed DNA polymerase from mobile element jockey-like protein n=1 Tax=Elysia marginata TaxID=1093978 RepID=A0AAV4FL51_9GAST|nr:RNA-directed DNA polymerase from mobile element jockey-like protein [Elysia marginata]